jgi:hypothetical protein
VHGMEVHGLKTVGDFRDMLEHLKLNLNLNTIPKGPHDKVYELNQQQKNDLEKYKYLDLNKAYNENVLHLRINEKEFTIIQETSKKYNLSLENAFTLYKKLQNKNS